MRSTSRRTRTCWSTATTCARRWPTCAPPSLWSRGCNGKDSSRTPSSRRRRRRRCRRFRGSGMGLPTAARRRPPSAPPPVEVGAADTQTATRLPRPVASKNAAALTVEVGAADTQTATRLPGPVASKNAAVLTVEDAGGYQTATRLSARWRRRTLRCHGGGPRCGIPGAEGCPSHGSAPGTRHKSSVTADPRLRHPSRWDQLSRHAGVLAPHPGFHDPNREGMHSRVLHHGEGWRRWLSYVRPLVQRFEENLEEAPGESPPGGLRGAFCPHVSVGKPLA